MNSKGPLVFKGNWLLTSPEEDQMLWGMMQFTGQRPQQLPPKMKEVHIRKHLIICLCVHVY